MVWPFVLDARKLIAGDRRAGFPGRIYRYARELPQSHRTRLRPQTAAAFVCPLSIAR